MVAALLAQEPREAEWEAETQALGDRNPLFRFFLTAYDAFADFLAKRDALLILLFVVLYKLTDTFAGVMTGPFVLSIGFDKASYAAIVKGVGLIASLLGGVAGGLKERQAAGAAEFGRHQHQGHRLFERQVDRRQQTRLVDLVSAARVVVEERDADLLDRRQVAVDGAARDVALGGQLGGVERAAGLKQCDDAKDAVEPAQIHDDSSCVFNPTALLSRFCAAGLRTRRGDCS